MSNKSSVTEPLMVQASAMVLRVREHLYAGLSQLLKPYGLTEPQFNVLRILRGAGTEGLPSLEVGRRMITRIPDVTRLLDRLEAEGLVTRTRGASDRRLVIANLTDKGRELLGQLDRPIADFMKDFGEVLEPDEVEGLIGLLQRLLNGSR